MPQLAQLQGRPSPSGLAPAAASQSSSRRLVIVNSDRLPPSLLDKPSGPAKPSPLKPPARPTGPSQVQPLKPPQPASSSNGGDQLKPPGSAAAAPASSAAPSAAPRAPRAAGPSMPAAPMRTAPPAPGGPGSQGGYINRSNGMGNPNLQGGYINRNNSGSRPPTNFPAATPGTQRVEPRPVSVSPAFQQRQAPASASAPAAPPAPPAAPALAPATPMLSAATLPVRTAAPAAPAAPVPPPMPGAPAAPSLARPAPPALSRPAAPAPPAPPSFGAPSSAPGLNKPALARPAPPAPPRPAQPPQAPMSRPGQPPALSRPGQSMQGSAPNMVNLTRPQVGRPGPPPDRQGDRRQAAGPRGDSRPQPRRPEPPSLRVLDPIISDEKLETKAGEVVTGGRLVLEEVVEDDVVVPDDEEGGKGKGKSKTKGGGKKGGKKEKVTAEMKRRAREQRQAERQERQRAALVDREEIFEVGEGGMSLEELAEAIQVDPSDIVRTLFMKGIMLSMNQQLDKATVKLVAQEYELLVVDKDEDTSASAKKKSEFIDESDIDNLVSRPPVVTVMGHVDHGKTSLLDYIRKARVAAGEAGGITQAIGAYNVDVEVDGDKKSICFLDTPGHEAFSAMRARGARVTDIAIIIVAADDGVRPQTREAIAHAQAAEVPIIVAINKVDKPEADVERTKQGLLELNLVPEEWGGSTPMVPVSAKKGTGMEDLLQMVLWVAEEQQLMANPDKFACGTVIEAHLDKKVGAVSTLLVQAGTLRVGDVVAAGQAFGKVRSLVNDMGQQVTAAGPSIAVQLYGLNTVPQAGDEFQVYRTEADAKAAAKESAAGMRLQRMAEMTGGGSMVTLSSLATLDEDTESLQRLNLIVKGDTSGMVEAIKSALSALPQDSIVLRYLLSGTGDISSSDIDLAAASGGMILGFNLNPDEATLSYAKKLGVTVSTYNIIYNLIDDVKAAMEGKLRTVEERLEIGTAEVKAVFGTGKKKVAGCLVLDGRVLKGGLVSVVRGKAVVHEGELSSLRRIKDDVEEVAAGVECGLGCSGFSDWQAGDVLTCYQLVTKARRLEEAKATTVVDISSLG